MLAELDSAARQELLDATRRYLDEAGPLLAGEFEREVNRVVRLLIRLPQLGTPGIRGTRSFPLKRFPYSLHYRVEPALIRIFAVAHHGRRQGYWRSRAKEAG